MRRLLLASLVALGCGGEDLPPDTVAGVVNSLHITEEGIVGVAVDLADTEVAVHILDGDSYVRIEGSGGSDGRFSIASVPDGEVVLQVGSRFAVTSERDLDLSDTAFGRPDRTPASPGTTLSFDVSGLDSVGDTSFVYLTVPNAATSRQLSSPASGETSLTAVSSLEGFSLLNADRGDVLHAVHFTSFQDGAALYFAASQVFSASLTTTDGETTQVGGRFTTIDRDRSIEVDIAVEAWEELRAELVLAGEIIAEGPVLYQAYAGPDVGAILGGLVDVANFFPDLTTAATVSVGNPVPGRYKLEEHVSFTQFIDIDPDPERRVPVSVGISESGFLGEVAQGPIAPRIGLLADITADGLDAIGSAPTISESPTVAWAPPIPGEVDAYTLRVFRLPDDGSPEQVAVVVTPRTSFRFPAGLFVPGRYFIKVNAERSSAFDPRRPFVTGGRGSFSTTTSQIVTVE